MTAAAAPSNAINIHVFRNGDPFYKGRKFVVNQRQTRNFESFLSMVTTGVRPQYGAVRKLYTPTHGHKVNDLSDLENNKHYVAAGLEHFRQVQYFSIGRPDVHRHPNILQRSIVRPVAHSRIRASARIRKPADGPKVIHVFRNGDTLYPSVRLLLTKRMMTTWDTVLQIITDRVNLINGAVWRLWHMDGSRVIELSEIENEGTYVASGNERFKKVAYGMNGPLEPSSPRIRRPTPPGKKRPTLPVPRRPPRLSPGTVPAKKTPRKPAQPKPPDKRKKKKEKTAEQKEAETVLHSRPAMVKRSREKEGSTDAPLDFEEGEKGVFKAKESRRETRGAAEVTETVDTAVDLPIDQVKAEEVDDELDGLTNHVTHPGIKQEKDAGNPPTTEMGNHVTQPQAPTVVVKQEKDTELNRTGVLGEPGKGDEQLNHGTDIPPAEQMWYAAGNYNNNHQSHDFNDSGEPQTESIQPLEGGQDIAEVVRADLGEGIADDKEPQRRPEDREDAHEDGKAQSDARDTLGGREGSGETRTGEQGGGHGGDVTGPPGRGGSGTWDQEAQGRSDLNHVPPALVGDAPGQPTEGGSETLGENTAFDGTANPGAADVQGTGGKADAEMTEDMVPDISAPAVQDDTIGPPEHTERGRGEKGVFKAKESRRETRGAAEVTETFDTAVDLPIDQVKAEEVDDELDGLTNHVTHPGIKQEKNAGNPPTTEMGNHVTQPRAPTVVVKQGKDTELNRTGVLGEPGKGDEQLNHGTDVPPAEQMWYAADNYNNNQSHDFNDPGEPRTVSIKPLEGGKDIAEVVRAGLGEGIAGDKEPQRRPEDREDAHEDGKAQSDARDTLDGREGSGDTRTGDQGGGHGGDDTGPPGRGGSSTWDQEAQGRPDLNHVPPALDGDASGQPTEGGSEILGDNTALDGTANPGAADEQGTGGKADAEVTEDMAPVISAPAVQDDTIGAPEHTGRGRGIDSTVVDKSLTTRDIKDSGGTSAQTGGAGNAGEQLTFDITAEPAETGTVGGVNGNVEDAHMQ